MEDRPSSFDYEALLACGRGELFGEGNAQLPLPPMLMFDRITSISIDGRPVDPDGAYRMGTWAFLVSGGDNFRAAARGSDARDSGLLDRDAWVAYLGAHPGIAPDFRAPGVAVSGLGDGPVAIGADLELSLGGLDLTSIGAPETNVVPVWSSTGSRCSAAYLQSGSSRSSWG